VIGGGKDPQRTEDELRRGVVARIKNAEYVRLPNSGHLPHVEEPAALAALIVNFLSAEPVGEVES
jgi:pimeloyl-ACP methyl ester carboxylesterase